MWDLGWLDGMLANPPRHLSELERVVGWLDVDFAGSEGFGTVVRPPHGTAPRGQLRTAVRELSAAFYFDMYHQDPHRVRDMALRALTLWLALPAADVRARFDMARAIEHDGRVRLERGEWFYIEDTAREPVWFAWHAERPEWALPTVPRSLREDFLATLVDRLACESAAAPIVAALSPLAAAAGADVHSYSHGIGIRFRPPLALATVLAAFRWTEPVAFSSDVHLSTWSVAPRAAFAAPPWHAQLGHWTIAPQLESWPRGPGGTNLPQLDRRGPSPLYDLADCETRITAIEIRTSH